MQLTTTRPGRVALALGLTIVAIGASASGAMASGQDHVGAKAAAAGLVGKAGASAEKRPGLARASAATDGGAGYHVTACQDIGDGLQLCWHFTEPDFSEAHIDVWDSTGTVWYRGGDVNRLDFYGETGIWLS
jgi:hypothetical protein